jgi:PAS domain S-box-containing protein
MVVMLVRYRLLSSWIALGAVGVGAFGLALSWALPDTVIDRPQPWETVLVWLVLAGVPVAGLRLWRRETTEQRAAELAETKRRLSAYVETGEEMLWEMDRNGVMSYISPIVQDYLHYTPEEVVGRHADIILPSRERSRLARQLERSTATAAGWNDEPYTFITKEGTEVPAVSSGVAHVSADGEVKGFTGTVRRAHGPAARQRELEEKRARVRDVLLRRAVRTVFQPIADVATGAVIGAEALSRFDGEPRLPPDRWFADAVEVGLGLDLDLLAVELALTAARQLPPHLYLSVNLSPATVCSGRLTEVLRDAPVPPGRLVVEITEHQSVENYEALGRCIAELRLRGLRLAVDDAGAGYASFRHILGLSPDYIKLDRALIDGMDADPARRALVSAVVTFGREVKATVVAEGIETAAELRTARLLDVDCAQGFLIGRPSPAGPGWAEQRPL